MMIILMLLSGASIMTMDNNNSKPVAPMTWQQAHNSNSSMLAPTPKSLFEAQMQGNREHLENERVRVVRQENLFKKK